MGGPLFMGILSGLLVLMLAWSVYHFWLAIRNPGGSTQKKAGLLVHIKSIGLFAMITGILGQLIGLYSAFSAIERAADISPAIIFGGLKISMISTLYGICIYLLSLLIWFTLDFIAGQKLAGKREGMG